METINLDIEFIPQVNVMETTTGGINYYLYICLDL